MIELFSHMGLSNTRSIRTLGTRALYMVLISTKLNDIADDINPNILKSTANCVLELIRDRQSDYK
jgi:hypothetical protein